MSRRVVERRQLYASSILQTCRAETCAVQQREEIEFGYPEKVGPSHTKSHKINWGNLRLVGEGFADSQLKRALQEQSRDAQFGYARYRRKSAAHSSASQFPQPSGCVSRPATPIHITAFPPSVTSRQPGTRGHLAMACEFHLLCPTVNAT